MTRESEPEAPVARGGLKSDLIDAAVGLLETDGVETLSLRLVARTAGVSHMAPYRHFDGKDALLAAVAETGFRDLVRAIDDAVAKEDTNTLKSRAIGMAYIRFARRRPALYRLMFGPRHADEDHFPDLADAMNLAQARCLDAVSLLNPDTGRDGDAGSSRALGIAIWSLVHGLANLLIDDRIAVQGEAECEEQLVEQVLDIIGPAVEASRAR